MERPCAWKKYTPQQIEELEELCRGYKQFLSENKTERLCVKTGIKMAEEAGYVNLETVIAEGRALKAGDKVYAANHGKDLMLVNLGTAPLEQGFNILGATWTRRAWTSSRTPPSRLATWLISTRTTMAASRATTGSLPRSHSWASSAKRTAPPSTSTSVTRPTTRSLPSPTC